MQEWQSRRSDGEGANDCDKAVAHCLAAARRREGEPEEEVAERWKFNVADWRYSSTRVLLKRCKNESPRLKRQSGSPACPSGVNWTAFC